MTGPRIGSLCSGYGGLDLAVLAVYGGTIAWHAETDPAACTILARHWPGVPNLGDITVVDWSTVEPVDVLAGGTPCQDLSEAKADTRRGLRTGTRSGLWTVMCHAIDALRPGLVVWENVVGALAAGADSDLQPCSGCVGDDAALSMRALGRVLADLARVGYDAQWCCVSAADVGAPHERRRLFLTAFRTDAAGARRGSWPPVPRSHARMEQGRSDEVVAGSDVGALARWGGAYAGQLERWGRVLDRPVPDPVEAGTEDDPRMSARFVEWLMGLPDGHVTQTNVKHAAQLHVLGNGVVPRQAEMALRHLHAVRGRS